jgi:hypothetical protein
VDPVDLLRRLLLLDLDLLEYLLDPVRRLLPLDLGLLEDPVDLLLL